MPYNHEEIQALLSSYKNTCVGYFAGHYHDGGSFRDEDNILHITFPCIVEGQADSNSFSIVKVYESKVEIENVTDDVKFYEIKI